MSSELEKELRELQAGPEPPAWLEDQVVAKMAHRGLPGPPRPFRARVRSTAAILAACAACFLAGAYLGFRSAAPAAPPAGARFILFLQEREGAALQTPQQEARLVREYGQWARKEHAAGRLLEGEKLKSDALSVRGPAGEVEVESPAQDIGGFFIVVAPDLEGAVNIARTCPHLRHGGRIVIRPIEPTS